MREKKLRSERQSERMTERMYWNVPRVVFTYVTARVFYNMFMLLWSGVGKYLLCIIVGMIVVALLS